MIDLTPLDVRNKRGDFKKLMRGYDPQEVDSFLELVAERLEMLTRENIGLRERSETLQQQVNSQTGREQAVQEALAKLKTRFVHEDPDQSYRRDGAVAVARFEDNDADVDDNEEIRDLRILRQRQVADLMGQFFAALA